MFGVCVAPVQQFISSPMRKGHEQHEPHVGDGGFRVNEGLERKREDNCSPPPELFSADTATPENDQQSGEWGWEYRRKFGRENALSDKAKLCKPSAAERGVLLCVTLYVCVEKDVL